MAQRVFTKLIDDLDGSEADETVTFAIDGVDYEIDLTTGHAKDLREALAPYASAGRRIGKRTGKAGRKTRSATDPREIRDWARSNGIDVPDRGRVPREVVDAFNQR